MRRSLAPTGLPAPADGPILGRRRELGALDAALRALGDGRPRVVQLAGDPGTGKTRLLTWLRARARQHGLPVAAGRASPSRPGHRFDLVVEAFEELEAGRTLAAARELPPHVLALLSEVLPDLAPATGAPVHLAGGPAERRYQMLRAWRSLLEQVAGGGGLVLVLDQLEWADPGTHELVEYLLRRPPRAPLLIALGYRPRQLRGSMIDALATSVRDGLSRRVEIGPLPPSACQALPPVAALPPSLRRAVLARGRHNPGLLYALAASAAGRDPAPGGEVSGPPETLSAEAAAAACDLDALSPTGRLVVQSAAVVGEDVDPGLVAEVADLDEAASLAGVDELVACDILRPGATGLRFRDPVVRSACYGSSAAGWRIGAHRRAAAALGRRNAPVTERAWHVEEAYAEPDPEGIRVLLDAAAEYGERRPEQVSGWMRTALRARWLADGDRAEPLARLARSDALAGRLDRSLRSYRTALAGPGGTPSGRRALLSGAAEVALALGLLGEARDLLREGLPDAPEDPGLHLLLARLVHEDPDAGPAERTRAAGRLVELAGPADGVLQARLLGSAAALLAAAGDRAAAAGHAAAAAAALAADPDGPEACRAARCDARATLAETALELGSAQDAVTHAGRGLAIAEDSGLGVARVRLHACLGTGLLRSGRPDLAAEHAEAARTAAERAGGPALAALAHVLSGHIALHHGRPAAARWYGETAAAAARHRSVRDAARALLAELRPAPVPPVGPARGEIGAGGLPATPTSHPDLRPAPDPPADRTGETPPGPTHDDSTNDPPDPAPSGVPGPPPDGPAGSASHAPAGSAPAVVAGPVPDGVPGHGPECGRGADAAAEAGTELGVLSRRELEVAVLVSRGRTNQQIARRLTLSHKTVETYLRRIFAKLDVSSRSEVAAQVGLAAGGHPAVLGEQLTS
jgi:DNA-binding CsgD family transcriptional regulator